jgi:hypothetical protein
MRGVAVVADDDSASAGAGEGCWLIRFESPLRSDDCRFCPLPKTQRPQVRVGRDGGWDRFNGVRDQTPRPPNEWGTTHLAVTTDKSRCAALPACNFDEALA